MDRLAALRAEAADVAERIENLGALDTDNAADVSAREMELKGLVERAAKLNSDISFEEKVAESAKSLRAVADRCTPAPEVREEAPARIEPVSYRGRLKAFSNDEQGRRDAYSFGNGQVVRLVEEFSVWPAAMQNVVMPSDTVTAVKRLTGVSATWSAENAEIATSDPSATDIRLVAKKLTVSTRVSNELLADAAAVGDWVIAEFATAIGEKLDQAAVNGDGTNTYGGVYGIANKILTAAGSYHTADTNHDTYAELDINDFLGVVAKLPTYVTSPRWYISSYGFAQSMQRLDLGSGGRVSFENGTGFNFLGYPVTISNVMPKSGDQSGNVMALLGDASLAGMYGIRSAFQTKISTERYVEYDQTLYIGLARADMNFHSVGSATEAGPLVALVGQ
jgi:HK97 family phage major capsid protein